MLINSIVHVFALCVSFIIVFFSLAYNQSLPSVLWHCWLGDRKGIQPVIIFAPASPKGSSLGDVQRMFLTWSDLWKHRSAEEKPEVVVCRQITGCLTVTLCNVITTFSYTVHTDVC